MHYINQVDCLVVRVVGWFLSLVAQSSGPRPVSAIRVSVKGIELNQFPQSFDVAWSSSA